MEPRRSCGGRYSPHLALWGFVLVILACMQPITADKADYVPEHVQQSHDLPVTLLVFNEIDSTNAWVERNQNLLVENYGLSTSRWVIVTAKSQTDGIGTYDTPLKKHRNWVSPDGANIYATFVFSWPTDKKSKFINFAQIATHSVAKTLETLNLRTQIKWVNDVLIGGKKVAGVLPKIPEQRVTLDNKYNVIVMVGIGININEDPSPEVPATNVLKEYEKLLDVCHNFLTKERVQWFAMDLLTKLMKNLTKDMFKLSQDGFAPFRLFIEDHLLWKDEMVIIDIDGITSEGVVDSLSRDGEVVLKKKSGELTKFTVGHMRLA